MFSELFTSCDQVSLYSLQEFKMAEHFVVEILHGWYLCILPMKKNSCFFKRFLQCA